MNRTALLVLAAAIAWAAPSKSEPPAVDADVQELYDSMRPEIEATDITIEMLALHLRWAEGLMVLGYCSDYVPASEVAFWQDWLGKPGDEHYEAIKPLINKAFAGYRQGLEEGQKSRPGLELCDRMVSSWYDDMEVDRDRAEFSGQ